MDPIPQRVFKPSSTMFSPDVANMHWLLTMHLQCRINLCIDVRNFIGGFVHLGTSLAPGQRFTVCTLLT